MRYEPQIIACTSAPQGQWLAASPGAPALAAAVEQRVRGSWDESFS
jgi:hypothetical protein